MGIGAAVVALSDHPILQIKFLSRLGQLTLGIYAVHRIFVDLLNQIPHSPSWEVIYVAIVFVLSALFSYALSKHNITKKFVV
jgi:surface polysaccharide O-acyltransferase-like enzyme